MDLDKETAYCCKTLIIKGGLLGNNLKELTDKFDFTSLIHLDYFYNHSGPRDLDNVVQILASKLTGLQVIKIKINATFQTYDKHEIEVLYSFLKLLSNSKTLLSVKLSIHCPLENDFSSDNGNYSSSDNGNYSSSDNGNDFSSDNNNELKLAEMIERVCCRINNNRVRGVLNIIDKFLIREIAQLIYSYVFGPMHFGVDSCGQWILYEGIKKNKNLYRDSNYIVLENFEASYRLRQAKY